MKIEMKEIVERGYLFIEEYEALVNEKDLLIKVWAEELDESFWGLKIEDEPNLFVFLNSPICFWVAPRPVVGMVGYMSDHTDGRNVMRLDKTVELLKKAGQVAIDYHKECIAAGKTGD